MSIIWFQWPSKQAASMARMRRCSMAQRNPGRYADDPVRQNESSSTRSASITRWLSSSACSPYLPMLFTVAKMVPVDSRFCNILPSIARATSDIFCCWWPCCCYPLHNFCSSILVYNLPFYGSKCSVQALVTANPAVHDGRHGGHSRALVWLDCASSCSSLLRHLCLAACSRSLYQAHYRKRAAAQMANKPIEVDVVRKKRSHALTKRLSSLVKQNNFCLQNLLHDLIVKLLYWLETTWRMKTFSFTGQTLLMGHLSWFFKTSLFQFESILFRFQLTDAEMNKIADTAVFYLEGSSPSCLRNGCYFGIWVWRRRWRELILEWQAVILQFSIW